MSLTPKTAAAQSIGRYVEREWRSNPAGPTRRARRQGRYRAFVPDSIAERSFPLSDDASLASHGATKALQRLQQAPLRIATLGAVAQNLLRSESVASSRIEGVLTSHKRLARASHLGPGRGLAGARRRRCWAMSMLSGRQSRPGRNPGRSASRTWSRSIGCCCASSMTTASPASFARLRTGSAATTTTRSRRASCHHHPRTCRSC